VTLIAWLLLINRINMYLKKILLNLFLLSSIVCVAQEGIIRGQIIDDKTAEEMIGVSVLIEGTLIGSATDLDGKFEIKAEPGTYSLRISYVSYASVLIKDVVVKAGEVKVLGTIRIKEDAELINEVVVTATAIKNTETSLMTLKRKSANLMDGISATNFKKIGDSDAATAMTRVTGVSVQGGKYVYVRGLGDRYTKTTLNGMDIPGLDPDRNTVQMDIFPTNIIDNITVSKSFTAEQSADFTGGAVNIELNDFPDERTFNVGFGLGYNPAMHFNKNFTTYKGGQTDFLGFDNGTRAIPTDRSTNIPQYANVVGNPNGERGLEYQRILREFNPQMGTIAGTSMMDFNANISYANTKKFNKASIGYNMALTYKNETEFFEDAEFNLYAKASSPSETALIALEQQNGSFGVNNVLLGAMGGVALKTEKSKYRISLLHLQNGEKKAGNFDFVNTNLGANFEATQYNLEYSEKALSNALIEGTHTLPKKWKMNWKFSPTKSSITDPDIRFLRFREPNQTVSTEVGMPERIWRYLEENNYSVRNDITKDYMLFGNNAKLRFGGSYTYKNRDYEIQSFQIIPGNTSFTGNPDELFAEENLFSSSNLNGVRYEPLFIPTNPNKFNSSSHLAAAYVSNEFNIAEPLKAIVGLRVEKYSQLYTGTNQTGTLALNNEKVLDDFDFFPSLNLIYSITEMQNLRFSFSQTIARPSFKEMSYAEILDPITGRTFIGSMLTETTSGGTELLWDGQIQSTKILNFDLRWELFQSKGRMLSLSAFYKKFSNPIEIVQYLADPGSFQARNVGDANVIGGEFELRQNFEFIAPKLENLSFNANVTYTYSSIKLSESELRSRTLSAREGEIIAPRREMAGQAPYLINAGLTHTQPKWKLESGVFYNVQGETLLFVGFANRTNVYSVPFHSLNLKISKTLGKDDRIGLSFKASNLVGDVKEQIFKSYEADSQIFTSLRPQRTFSVSFSYKL
jgi:TonB-dependent receptor